MKWNLVMWGNVARNIFLQISCWKWGRDTSSRPNFACWESFFWGNSKCSASYFQYILIAFNLAYSKYKMYKTYAQFWFFRKGSGNSFFATFCVWFSKNNVYHVMFYQLTKFRSLGAFTYWDIGQFLYCNCFLTSLWRHQLWN